MGEERPGYFAIIPAEVRYDDRIPANAKLLYGEISALIGAEGFCYAGNTYFASVYKMSNENIARLITKLEQAGHIKREVVKDQNGQIIQRKIYLRVSMPEIHNAAESINADPAETQGGIDKKINTSLQKNQEGIDKKIKETNTSITNIEKENKKEKGKAMTDDQIREAVKDWIVTVSADWTRGEKNSLFFALTGFYEPRATKKQEPARTKAAFTALRNRLVRYSAGDPAVMVDMLERATTAGWKSVFPLLRNSAPVKQPAEERQYECV